jgi:hypothetical protein
VAVCLQEIKRRMRNRFSSIRAVILAVTALIATAVLVACSAKYASTSNGLVVVSTQGSAVMDTFSLDLGNGHMTQIFNSAGPPTSGVPTTVVLAPGGSFAYVLLTASKDLTGSSTGIGAFPVASDGKLGASAATTPLNPEIITLPGNQTEKVPAVPTAMIIDSAGKFLFLSDSSTADSSARFIPGAVSVFSIGSGGGLTEVTNSPFVLPIGGPNTTNPTPCPASVTCSSASALAITPTIYPPAYALCSGNAPPTTENLFVTDSVSYTVLNYSVGSTGALTLVPSSSSVAGVATGTVPSGVTVDPCNRFVYVSNGQPNDTVSAFTMCSMVSLPLCPVADFHLIPVVGSPFVAGPGPVALIVDPLAAYLYVLDQGENAIRPYKISTTTGALTPLSPATVATNSYPTSIAIRSDDSWMFVTNLNQANLSQYAITPATGALSPQPPVQTDNNPWGVAVK